MLWLRMAWLTIFFIAFVFGSSPTVCSLYVYADPGSILVGEPKTNLFLSSVIDRIIHTLVSSRRETSLGDIVAESEHPPPTHSLTSHYMAIVGSWMFFSFEFVFVGGGERRGRQVTLFVVVLACLLLHWPLSGGWSNFCHDDDGKGWPGGHRRGLIWYLFNLKSLACSHWRIKEKKLGPSWRKKIVRLFQLLDCRWWIYPRERERDREWPSCCPALK